MKLRLQHLGKDQILVLASALMLLGGCAGLDNVFTQKTFVSKQLVAEFGVDETHDLEVCGAPICFRDKLGKFKKDLDPRLFRKALQDTDSIVFKLRDPKYCYRVMMFSNQADYDMHGLKQGQTLLLPTASVWPFKPVPENAEAGKYAKNTSNSIFIGGLGRIYYSSKDDWEFKAEPIDGQKSRKSEDDGQEFWYKIELIKADKNDAGERECTAGKKPEIVSDDPRIKFKHVRI